MKLICNYPSPAKKSEIEIRNGLLNKPKEISSVLNSLASRFVIITSETIAPLYGDLLQQSLAQEGLDVSLLSFPSGESYKTRQTKEMLEDQMFAMNMGRDTCVIALGGGVVTDVA